MEAVVDEAFGDVHCVDAVAFLAGVAENNFVQGGQGIGKVEYTFEMFTDVVGVEDGVFGSLTHARAIREDVGESADEYTEVSAEGADFSDGGRANSFESEPAAIFLYE